MDLIWNKAQEYESIIDESVFYDLGIISLFEKFRSDPYDIIEVIKHLPKLDTIEYRRSIFEDFLNDKEDYLIDIKKLADNVVHFHKVYTLTIGTLKKRICFLLYIKQYIGFYEEVNILVDKLELKSNALLGFRDHVQTVLTSQEFKTLKQDLEAINLERIKKYIVRNKGKVFALEEYDNEVSLNNYLKSLLNELPDIDIRRNFSSPKEIDSIYLLALEKAYGVETKGIEDFHAKYSNLTFSLSSLGDHIEYYHFFKQIFTKTKLPYCKPLIGSKGINIKDSVNVSLYEITENIVPNDVDINKVTVITGVNGGGKTSFLQGIGCSYIFLFAVGYIFASSANLPLIKHLYTHFPNNEVFKLGYGRLKTELHRLDKMSKNFSKDCLVLLNETFSSTDDKTAFVNATKLIKKIQASNTKCLFVTHHQNITTIEDIDILIPLTDKHNKRLFKIVRKVDDINMYTYDILYRYRLTKEQLRARARNEEV